MYETERTVVGNRSRAVVKTKEHASSACLTKGTLYSFNDGHHSNVPEYLKE